MPNNRSQAEHCTRQLKRRLIKNPQLQEDYKAFVEEIFQVFNVVSEISLFRNISFIQCGNGKPRLALLLVCGDTEKHPGKAPSVYHCGFCELPVDWSDVAVPCDECSIWQCSK